MLLVAIAVMLLAVVYVFSFGNMKGLDIADTLSLLSSMVAMEVFCGWNVPPVFSGGAMGERSGER